MIHQYKLNNYNIVLDIASGAVHSVDDLAYDVIALFEHCGEDEIVTRMLEQHSGNPEITRADVVECIAEVRELRDRGLLFTRDGYADRAAEPGSRPAHVKALCLHVSQACNLDCGYCFAARGRHRGGRAHMSFDTGRRALDFLIESSGGQRNLEVDFFGGEPLLNWQVCKDLVAYARGREAETGKRFRFTLTTNGLLLDEEVTDFANREIVNVVLSLDGCRETNDRFRKTPEGRGCYDLIVPKFLKFAEARGDREYYIRGTFTRFNREFTRDILHIADLGFGKISMEPVVCSASEPYALGGEDLPVLLEQYELLAREMLRRSGEGRGFTFYHYMIDLEKGPCVHKRISGCGVGTEYLAVTPSGELYPCHQLVGDENFRMGDVWNGVSNTALRERFARQSAYSRPACRSCWARLYCSGGCAANAHRASGDIDGVYEYGCELFKKRIECGIALAAATGGGE